MNEEPSRPKAKRLRVPIEDDEPSAVIDLPYGFALVVDERIAAWCYRGEVVCLIERGEA